jgi:hypothetical protein
MPSTQIADVLEMWHAFLTDTELAKHYVQASMIVGRTPVMAPNPILDRLLPSLFLLRLGSLLDEILKEYIDERRMTMDRKDDLNGKITFLDNQGFLFNADKLHAIRRRRNALAHESGESCTWEDLEDAISTVDAELQHLGVVGPMPKYEFYGESIPREQAEPGHFVTFDVRYGIRENGKTRLEVTSVLG